VDTVENVSFAHPVERELADALDAAGIPWLYEPRTFVLERHLDGRPAEAVTPDFYLPDQDIYVECSVQRPELLGKKRRKLRKLEERYGVIVALLDRRDFHRIAERYGLAFSTTTPSPGASETEPSTRSPRRPGEVETATAPAIP
jgi:hypoxanthine phosphoribosyltransferase